MDYPPDYSLESRQPIFTSSHRLGKLGTQEITFELASCRYIDFPLAILATVTHKMKNILAGWVGFYTYRGSLSVVIPNSMELRETKVDPDFFRSGLGSMLVQVALAVAQYMNKILYLKPERPGSGVSQETRDENFPLSTEQLRNFYLANGFRDLTDCERTTYTELLLGQRLANELYPEGFNPRTGNFSKKADSTNPTNPRYQAIVALSLAAKLEALERYFEMEKKASLS